MIFSPQKYPKVSKSPHLDFEKSGFSRPDRKLLKTEVWNIYKWSLDICDFLGAT